MKVVYAAPGQDPEIREIPYQGSFWEDVKTLLDTSFVKSRRLEKGIHVVMRKDDKALAPLATWRNRSENSELLLRGPIVIMSDPPHRSMPEKKLEKYLKLFRQPREFFQIGGRTYSYGGNRKWIDTVFTNVIADMISDGYVICTSASTGKHAGQEGNIRLYKNGRVVRVLLSRFDEGRVGTNRLEGFELSFAVWDYENHGLGIPPMYPIYGPFFDNEFIVEDSVRFYVIGYTIGHPERWYGSKEQAKASLKKHDNRYGENDKSEYSPGWQNRWEPAPEHESRAKELIAKAVSSIWGFASVKPEEITNLFRYTRPIGFCYRCDVRGRMVEIFPGQRRLDASTWLRQNKKGKWVEVKW